MPQKKYQFSIALSGGGFRATLFHLGVIRRLNEIGLLRFVDSISSVSGGSILSSRLAVTSKMWKNAVLSDNDWDQVVKAPVWRFCSQNIRTVPFLNQFNPFSNNGGAKGLQLKYDSLTEKKMLSDLPENVEFHFCSTDLVNSTIWYYRKDGSYCSNRSKGKHPLSAQNIHISEAVAASSCFPPLFTPFPIMGNKPTQLTDGGVYDNLGLEPVWDASEFLLVSDVGRPLPRKRYKSIGDVKRYSDVIQDQVSSLRERWMMSDLFSDKLKGLAFCNINKGFVENRREIDGFSDSLAKEVLGQIRTDLDRFSEVEMSVLENHGYSLADYYIFRGRKNNKGRYFYESLPEDIRSKIVETEFKLPNPEWDSEVEEVIRKKLKNSHKRTFLFFLRQGLI